jgi:O-antigen/teichoic acid export membrane protein
MGPEYRTEGGAVLRVLSLSLFTQAAFQVTVTTMIGLNRHRGVVPALMLEAAVNVALSVALAPRLGVAGVAWGTTLPRLVTCLAFSPLYAWRQIGLDPRRYWWHGILRPALAVAPFALACWAVEQRWPAASLPGFFAQVAATLPLAALGVWAFALEPEERRSALSLLRRRAPPREPDRQG